jgi:hypothetical protein
MTAYRFIAFSVTAVSAAGMLEHRQNEHHANEQGDQNGEKTGRERQVMKLAEVHWCCSPLSATKLV